MAWLKKIQANMKKNQKGILAGGLIGAGIVFYLKAQGISMMAAVSETGLIDKMMSTATPLNIAFIKMLVLGVVVGAVIGYIVDDLIG